MTTTELAKIVPGVRLTGEPRATFAKQVKARYTGGDSIRTIAGMTGRSYGAIHKILSEAGVQFRPRGGAHR